MPVKNIVRGQSVSSEMHERAKELRGEMTPAEKILWNELRTNKLNGLHFRRQQNIDMFIADFYCFRVIRFANEDVFNDLKSVLQKIVIECKVRENT